MSQEDVPVENQSEKSPRELEDLKEEISNNRLRILRLARKILKFDDKNYAEDIAQEVIAQAIHKADQFAKKSSLRSWLGRITINAVYNFYRKGKNDPLRQQLKIASGSGEEDNSRLLEMISSPDKAENRLILEMDLEKVMAKLPDDKFEIIRMLQMGYTPAEIAEFLGIEVRAAKSRIYRAKQELAGLLK